MEMPTAPQQCNVYYTTNSIIMQGKFQNFRRNNFNMIINTEIALLYIKTSEKGFSYENP